MGIRTFLGLKRPYAERISQGISQKRAPFRLGESEWFEILDRSVDDPSLGLPAFPSDAIQTAFIGSHGTASLREVRSFYGLICEHVDLSEAGPILDFGCGYGRMIRAFLNDFPAEQLFGVDVSEEALRLAAETRVPGNFHKIDPTGRLPFKDASFGLVYAYSVFTHLPEQIQDLWLSEIHRVLKPGGALVATVEPPRVFEHFASIDLSQPVSHPWLEQNARMIQGNPAIGAALRDRGFTFYGGEYYGDAFMTQEYLTAHWGQWFTIKDYLDDPARFFQAVVTATANK